MEFRAGKRETYKGRRETEQRDQTCERNACKREVRKQKLRRQKVQEERDKLEKYEQMLAQVKERMVGLG